MIGVIVNVITVLIGCTLGLIFRKGIPEKITNSAMVMSVCQTSGVFGMSNSI